VKPGRGAAHPAGLLDLEESDLEDFDLEDFDLVDEETGT
jgi:hypothetical protein